MKRDGGGCSASLPPFPPAPLLGLPPQMSVARLLDQLLVEIILQIRPEVLRQQQQILLHRNLRPRQS